MIAILPKTLNALAILYPVSQLDQKLQVITFGLRTPIHTNENNNLSVLRLVTASAARTHPDTDLSRDSQEEDDICDKCITAPHV